MRSDRFFAALLLVTFGPMLGVPALAGLLGEPTLGVGDGLPRLIAFLGTAHVAATIHYYMDGEYQPIIARESQRFVWPLLMLPLTFLLVLVISPFLSTLLYVAFFGWQMFHIARQSYGLVALAAASTRSGPLHRGIAWALNLAAASAAISSWSFPGLFPPGLRDVHLPTPWLQNAMHLTACATFLGSLTVLIFVWLVDSRLRRSISMSGLAFGGVGMFFGVTYFGPASGVLVCGLSHAGQYLLMTLTVARKIGRQQVLLSAVMCIALTSVFLWLYQSPGGYQLFLGIFAVHFLADAKIWRLREPEQRGIMLRRFYFLFQTSPN